MKNKVKTILIASLACVLISAVMVYASPGDNNDPLVTLSYITDVLIPDMDSRIDQKLAEISASQGGNTSSGGDAFSIVNIKANYKIIGDEGTEFVLRSGEGTIISTPQGGVADLTSGEDLVSGAVAPLNHHLLSPRNDSRGMAFSTDAIVLVKGAYSVSKN